MTTLQIIILTILVQQAICAIVYFASGEKEELTAIVSFGFVYVVIAGIVAAVQAIRLTYIKRNYNWYQFYDTYVKDGKAYFYHINNYLIHKSILDNFHNVVDEDTEITEPNTIRFLRSGKTINKVPIHSAMIDGRVIKKQKNVYGMKWATLKKFLK